MAFAYLEASCQCEPNKRCCLTRTSDPDIIDQPSEFTDRWLIHSSYEPERRPPTSNVLDAGLCLWHMGDEIFGIKPLQQVHESHRTSGTYYRLFAFRIPKFSRPQVCSYFFVKHHVLSGLIEHLIHLSLNHGGTCVYKLLDVLDASCYKPHGQHAICNFREHMHNS
ncbi:hypothetical protein GQX74_008142 [Glossina fuscipes]|nr:hypothetical protein GQX74_008142 [Glossina fuscipes]